MSTVPEVNVTHGLHWTRPEMDRRKRLVDWLQANRGRADITAQIGVVAREIELIDGRAAERARTEWEQRDVQVRADDLDLLVGILEADIAARVRPADPRVTEPLSRLRAAIDARPIGEIVW